MRPAPSAVSRRCTRQCWSGRVHTAPTDIPENRYYANACFDQFASLSVVIAGLVPAIPIRRAQSCLPKRDGRDKPGHDEWRGVGCQGTPVTTPILTRNALIRAPHHRFRDVTVAVKRDPDVVLRLLANEPLHAYPDRFHDHLWHWAKERPSQIFLAERRPGQEGWASVTYAEAADQVSRVAQA